MSPVRELRVMLSPLPVAKLTRVALPNDNSENTDDDTDTTLKVNAHSDEEYILSNVESDTGKHVCYTRESERKRERGGGGEGGTGFINLPMFVCLSARSDVMPTFCS